MKIIVLAGILGVCIAAPPATSPVYQHKVTDVGYEFHDVHQSPVPAIKQTFVHSAYETPVQTVNEHEKHVQHASYDAPAVSSHHYGHNVQVSPVHHPSQHVQAVAPVHYVQPQLTRSAPRYHNPVAILSMNQQATYDGNFNFGFESEDGIQNKAVGTMRAIEGSEFPGQVMKGSYSYVAPDGRQVVTNWYADETGFHAEGDHIPAMPEAIQRSVEYLRSLPPQKEDLDESHTRKH